MSITRRSTTFAVVDGGTVMAIASESSQTFAGELTSTFEDTKGFGGAGRHLALAWVLGSALRCRI